MRVALLERLPTDRLIAAEAPDPVPAQDELVVRIEACGICGTDLHIMAGQSYQPPVPFVLGHEPVGVVVQSGSKELDHWVGRRVTMTIFEGCGKCDLCKSGSERLCNEPQTAIGALGRWGGFAELMAIPAAQAVDVPLGLSSPKAASLVDAGATAANSLEKLTITPHTPVVVGGGPVGFFVAELMRYAQLQPLVVEINSIRAAELERIGHRVVHGVGELDARPDAVVDCTGAPEVLPWALDALLPRGTFVAASYAVISGLNMALVSRKELTIRGVRSGSRSDLVDVLDLAASQRIRMPNIRTWGLVEINEALAELRAGSVAGKAVIVP